MVRRVLPVGIVAGFVLLVACGKTKAPVMTKCASDADCTYVTTERGDCCVNPCGGVSKAVHKDEATAIAEYNKEYCTPARQKECPVAGACAQPTPGPKGPVKCVAGGCVEPTGT